MFGAPFPGGGSVIGAFGSSASASNTWSFSGLSFGTPAANRYVVAVFGWSGGAISAVTISGVTATKVLDQAGSARLQVWIALVPTGSTGTVASNGGGTGTVICSTYAIYGTSTPFAPTIVSGNASLSQTQNVVGGSFALMAGYTVSGAATLNGVTLDHTQTQSLSSLATGSLAFAQGQSGYTFSATVTGAAPECGLAIWTP